jgi:galactose-1-phosphate uridylyltransferase
MRNGHQRKLPKCCFSIDVGFPCFMVIEGRENALETPFRKFMVGFEMLAMAQRDLTPDAAADRLRAALG